MMRAKMRGMLVILAAALLLHLGMASALAETFQKFEIVVQEAEDLAAGADGAALFPVTFYDLAGKVFQARSVVDGETLEPPADPVAVGMTFIGWFEAETPEILFDFDAPVTQAVHLLPLFQIDEVIDGGTEERSSESGSILDVVTLPDATPAPADAAPPEAASGILTTFTDAYEQSDAAPAQEDSPFQVVAQEESSPFPIVAQEEDDNTGLDLLNSMTSSILGTGDIGTSEQEDILNMAAGMLDDGDRVLFMGGEAVEIDDEELVSKAAGAEPTPEPVVEPPRVTMTRIRVQQGEATVISYLADVENVPDGAAVRFQWQNDASGEFVDVGDARGELYILSKEDAEAEYAWRVNVYVYPETK